MKEMLDRCVEDLELTGVELLALESAFRNSCLPAGPKPNMVTEPAGPIP